MKNSLRFRRGDLRIASLLFVAALIPGGVAKGLAREAQASEMYTVRLSVGASGFEPARISVPLGAVHFVVTSREGDHCFAIPSMDVEKRVRSGRPLEVDVTFERAGEYPFLCCVESSGTRETGVIVVATGK